MKRRTKLRIWLNVGELLALTPMILSGLPTAASMFAAYSAFGQGLAPVGPSAEAVHLGLILGAVSSPLCPIGLLIVVVSIVKLRQDKHESRRQTA